MAQDGTFLPGTGPAELFLTSGDTGAKLRRRALWLLRAADLGAIDLTKVRVCCACPSVSVWLRLLSGIGVQLSPLQQLSVHALLFERLLVCRCASFAISLVTFDSARRLATRPF